MNKFVCTVPGRSDDYEYDYEDFGYFEDWDPSP